MELCFDVIKLGPQQVFCSAQQVSYGVKLNSVAQPFFAAIREVNSRDSSLNASSVHTPAAVPNMFLTTARFAADGCAEEACSRIFLEVFLRNHFMLVMACNTLTCLLR